MSKAVNLTLVNTNDNQFKKAMALYNKATLLGQTNNLEKVNEAIKLFNQALELTPDYIDCYHGQMIAWNTLGEEEKALECCNKFLLKAPNDSEMLSNKSIILYKKGIKLVYSSNLEDAKESIKWFDQALDINPKRVEFYKGKYTAYAKLEHEPEALDKAIECCNQALLLEPTNTQILHDTSHLLRCKGDKLFNSNTTKSVVNAKEAIAYYDRALKLDPNNWGALNNKTAAHAYLGDIEEAIKSCDIVISNITSAIDSVEKKLFASSMNAKDQKQISKIVEQIKGVVEEKKHAYERDVVLNQVISKQAVQEDIIKALVEHVKTDKQTLDLHMNFIMELKKELGMHVNISSTISTEQTKVAATKMLDTKKVDNRIEEEKETKEPLLSDKTEKTCCEKLKETCMIFSITEIKYDNPLLNHPELLKSSMSKFDFNVILDRSTQISNSLMTQIINNNDSELLMGALMSLDHD